MWFIISLRLCLVKFGLRLFNWLLLFNLIIQLNSPSFIHAFTHFTAHLNSLYLSHTHTQYTYTSKTNIDTPREKNGALNSLFSNRFLAPPPLSVSLSLFVSLTLSVKSLSFSFFAFLCPILINVYCYKTKKYTQKTYTQTGGGACRSTLYIIY